MPRIKEIKNLKNLIAAFFLVFGFSVFSLAYFIFLDADYYVKLIFRNARACEMAFWFPVPYALLAFLFVVFYSRLLNQKLATVAYPSIAMGAVLSFFYLLADMKIGLLQVNPFGLGSRGIYDIYSTIYSGFLISIFSSLSGFFMRKIIKKEINCLLNLNDQHLHNIIFHLPILVYFFYIENMLLKNGLGLFAFSNMVLFAIPLFMEKFSGFIIKFKTLLKLFFNNEKLLLTTIFIFSFLIRYIWGERLLSITGDNFILASDDGNNYDRRATIIAQGEIIPQNLVFSISGFCYWYFIAGVYKIFGLQNFRALFTIQALFGATVPVFAYLIAKEIFKNKIVPIIASLIICIDMLLIFLSVVIAVEALYIPTVMIALFVTVNAFSSEIIDAKKTFVVGCLFGLAYNFRTPELLFYPFFLAIIIYFILRKKRSAKDMIPTVGAIFVGFFLLISVQYMAIYMLWGYTPEFQSAVYQSFYHGDPFTSENKILGQMGFNPFFDFWLSINAFLNDPITIAHLLLKGFVKRTIILFAQPNFGVFDPIFLVNPGSGFFFKFPLYVLCLGYLLIIVGILASLKDSKNKFPVILLISFLAYMTVRVAVFFVLNSRYRGVLMPTFIIFLASGFNFFLKKLKSAYEQKCFHNQE